MTTKTYRSSRHAGRLLALLALAGCAAGGESCPERSETYGVATSSPDGCEGWALDVLVVVDSAEGMAEEHELLSTGLYSLVDSLMVPLAGNSPDAAIDLRLAVVTADMGLSWDGHPYTWGWPGTPPCSDTGDAGELVQYAAGATVPLLSGQIPCAGAEQCPAGWACAPEDGADVAAVCVAPGPDQTQLECPELDDPWTEYSHFFDDNPHAPEQAACLAAVGTDGCQIAQPLAVAPVAAGWQSEFKRGGLPLMVLLVSDGDDCSLEDGPAFFELVQQIAEEEGAPNSARACAEGAAHLAVVEDARQALLEELFRGAAGLIVAAFVGVPPGPDCEGRGDEIAGCLELPEMAAPHPDDDPDAGWRYPLACTRFSASVDDGIETITTAAPGRRLVQLAQLQRSNGLVSSICNPDWTPAMAELAEMARGLFHPGLCVIEELPWDARAQVPQCDLLLEFIDESICPFPLDEGDRPLHSVFDDADGVQHTVLHCPLPTLAAPLDCAAAAAVHPLGSDELGWYYCESFAEDFAAVCDPTGDWAGSDEDGDGEADCADEDCADCADCGGDGIGCVQACKYGIRFSGAALRSLSGQNYRLVCRRPAAPADPSCASGR